jgi:phytoene dehydrogenase-like protein
LLALAAGRSIAGTPMGGLGTLSKALASAAHAAGVEVSLGLEVTDILHDKRRACGVRLADGTEVEARAVVSTLDLRRSFFSLFAWKDLPSGIVKRVSAWRQSGSTARLLLALDNVPAIDREFLQGPIHIAPDYSALSKAFAAWRTGTMAERLPLVMRIVSALDPGLAPQRKSAATVTIGCIPYRLFDGPWTNEKRVALTESVLASIDAVLPGTARSVLGSELILPPDIEQVLGLTGGDLDGGEIAPDQMFGKRGFPEHSAGRTPIAGLYLGGRASPAGVLGTCAAGIAAARALIADSSAGLIR